MNGYAYFMLPNSGRPLTISANTKSSFSMLRLILNSASGSDVENIESLDIPIPDVTSIIGHVVSGDGFPVPGLTFNVFPTNVSFSTLIPENQDTLHSGVWLEAVDSQTAISKLSKYSVNLVTTDSEGRFELSVPRVPTKWRFSVLLKEL